jgi:hypothetical protein
MLARISPASLVQANGCGGWSFQVPVNVPMMSVCCGLGLNDPRQMACRVMSR